jgi:hypothetical protein
VWRNENYNFAKNPKEIDYVGGLGIDRRVISKLVFGK